MNEISTLRDIYIPYDDEDKDVSDEIRITTLQEAIEDTGIKILVYGISGAGKTVLSATAGKRTLILSSESGIRSLKKAPDYVKTIKVRHLKQLNTIYHMLGMAKEREYDWIVIDSLSEIAEMILENEMEHLKDGRQYWWFMAQKVTKIIKGFRDLPHYNVLFTAKQDRIVDQDTGRTYYGPSLPGQSLKDDIPHLFDEIFNIRIEKDKKGREYRILQTGLDMQFLAKDRSGELEIFEKANLKHIEKLIRGDDYEEYLKPYEQQKIQKITET